MNHGHPIVWWLIVMMTTFGILTHWLKQLAMMRKSSSVPGLGFISVKTYWVTYWPETLAAVTSSAAGIALLYEMDMLSNAIAFGVGYMGNSMADVLGGRLTAMINAAPLTTPPTQPAKP